MTTDPINNQSTNSSNQSQPTPTLSPDEEKALYEAKKTAMFQAINRMKTNTSQTTSSFNTRSSSKSLFTPEQVDQFMKSPASSQKQLRQLSSYLYDYSGEYRQVIDYMSDLAKFAHVIDPLFITTSDTDWKAVEKTKLKVAQEMNKLSLSHELSKVTKDMWKQDTFYGYEHESKDSFFIQHMDADYCRLSSQDYDGVFLYEFDFSYFDSNAELLKNYPAEFHKKYQTYKNTKENWIELNPDKAMAFKINEEITTYSLPPFGVMIGKLLELEEYEKLQKARAKMDNFMLLVQQIPLNDKAQGMDEFLVSLETAMEFHNIAVAGLGDGIGLLTTPLEVSSVKTEKGNKDRDNVASALKRTFDVIGISQFMFNSDKNTSVGLAKASAIHEQKIFKIYRQFERWLNRKVRKINGRYKFKIRLLDITNFDEDDAFNTFLKAAQSGFPSIEEASASIGINPMDLYNKLMIENSPIGYQAKMKPLATSHTQSSKDSSTSGAPIKSDDEISDSTQINRDANTDENKE